MNFTCHNFEDKPDQMTYFYFYMGGGVKLTPPLTLLKLYVFTHEGSHTN